MIVLHKNIEFGKELETIEDWDNLDTEHLGVVVTFFDNSEIMTTISRKDFIRYRRAGCRVFLYTLKSPKSKFDELFSNFVEDTLEQIKHQETEEGLDRVFRECAQSFKEKIYMLKDIK